QDRSLQGLAGDPAGLPECGEVRRRLDHPERPQDTTRILEAGRRQLGAEALKLAEGDADPLIEAELTPDPASLEAETGEQAAQLGEGDDGQRAVRPHVVDPAVLPGLR